MNNELVVDINQSLEISLPEKLSLEELKEQLTLHINELINHHFEKLVFYLYRIDVDELKMRQLLKHQEGKDTAGLIADLIIERQLQKMESRKKTGTDNTIPDEEKW